MKPSKKAMTRYIAGFALFVLSFIFYLIQLFLFGKLDIILILLGLNALSLMWILGIQEDLYKK